MRLKAMFYPFAVCFACCAGAAPAVEPVRFILDTDIASDCDDAGAVAMANALMDLGEADILAMMVSTGGDYGAPALSAINVWYGHGDIPIGTLKQPEFWSGGGRDKPSGAFNYESYSHDLAENFPVRLHSGKDAPDARVLYRKILAAQPNGSVVINSIGPLINLALLMEAKPDEHSPMNGMELIRAKVKLLVVAGGKNPSGTSSNFSKEDAELYARPVIDRWPSPVVFVGNEVGGSILTGWPKGDPNLKENPARAAYRLFHGGDSARKRPSWDQAGVLFAIRGKGDLFELVEDGRQTFSDDGKNAWVPEKDPARRHAYARKLAKDETFQEIIETLMRRQPM